MITVRVILFAVIRDLVGKESFALSVPVDSTVGAVIELLIAQYPKIHEWKHHVRVAVNQEYVSFDYLLHEQDEVVLIPPVSGG